MSDKRKLSDYLIDSMEHYRMCTNYLRKQREAIHKKFMPRKKWFQWGKLKTRRFNETKIVWYPLHILEEYIDLVKKTVRKNGEDPSGIAFYFSAYPDVGAEKPGVSRGKYSRRMTINLVPTLDKASIQNLESDINDGDEYSNLHYRPVVYGIKEGESESRLHLINKLEDFNKITNQNLILERGHSFPPPPTNG